MSVTVSGRAAITSWMVDESGSTQNTLLPYKEELDTHYPMSGTGDRPPA